MNLRSVKNQSSKSVEQLFLTTERLIKEQTETTGVSTINWDQRMWRESSLLCDRAGRIMNSKTFVFSDSVLCFGGISPEPVSSLERQNQMVFGKSLFKELDRIGGEQVEFEWTSFPKEATAERCVMVMCQLGRSWYRGLWDRED